MLSVNPVKASESIDDNIVLLSEIGYITSPNFTDVMSGSEQIDKIYYGDKLIYFAGDIVTYYVDSGTSYQEKIKNGESCLVPSTFIPAKSGWTFVGWREDTSANGTVLTSKPMNDSPVTLYAVFKQDVTVTYYDASTTAKTTSSPKYYNNGNITNAPFKLTQSAKSGWTARGWSTSTAGNASTTYAHATAFTRDSNVTLYGMYQQTITLSYNGTSPTSGSVASQTGTRYYNSSGNYVNPSFTVASNGFTKTDHAFATWAANSVNGTQYAPGSSITLTSNTTLYAIWEPSVLVVYDVAVSDASSGTYTVNEHDTSYITLSGDSNSRGGRQAYAGVWYEPDTTNSGTQTTTINYGNYSYAIIEYTIWPNNNCFDGRRVWLNVNGSNVYDSVDTQYSSATTRTYKTSAKSVTTTAYAYVEDDEGTYVSINAYVTNITLYK